ncbi:hypothetical protein [Candidatus Tisiphia endosymbiont of Xenochironomus xenolabis]
MKFIGYLEESFKEGCLNFITYTLLFFQNMLYSTVMLLSLV